MTTEDNFLCTFFNLSLNRWFRTDMSLLFGDGYHVIINHVKYSTNTKQHIIDCKLMVKEPHLCMDTYPWGLSVMVNKTWTVLLTNDSSIILSSTIDLIED